MVLVILVALQLLVVQRTTRAACLACPQDVAILFQDVLPQVFLLLLCLDLVVSRADSLLVALLAVLLDDHLELRLFGRKLAADEEVNDVAVVPLVSQVQLLNELLTPHVTKHLCNLSDVLPVLSGQTR